MQLDMERIKNGTFKKRLMNAYTEMVKAGSVDEDKASEYKSIYESETIENILDESDMIYREPIMGRKFYESVLTESVIPLHKIPYEVEKFESFVESNKDKMGEEQKSLYESTLSNIKRFMESRQNEIHLANMNLTSEREAMVNEFCEAVNKNDSEKIDEFFKEACLEDVISYGYYSLTKENASSLAKFLRSKLSYQPEMENNSELYRDIVRSNIYSSYILEDAAVQEDIKRCNHMPLTVITTESSNENYQNVISDIFTESVDTVDNDLITETGEDLMNRMFQDDKFYRENTERFSIARISNAIKSNALFETFMDLAYNEDLTTKTGKTTSKLIREFSGTDTLSDIRSFLEGKVSEYESQIMNYFKESSDEEDSSFFEYTRRGEATPVIRDNVGTLREGPVGEKDKKDKESKKSNQNQHDTNDEDEDDDEEEEDEEDIDEFRDDLDEDSTDKKSNQPVNNKPTNQKPEVPQKPNIPKTDKPNPGLTKKIQNGAMDTEMKMQQAKGKMDEKMTAVKNAAKAVITIPSNIVNGIQTKIKEWNEWDENKKKERILDSGYRSTIFKTLKTAITYGAVWEINKVWVIWLYIFRHTPIYKDRNSRIKNELLVELDTEIQVTEEKIQDASSNGDQKQKYQLMRLKKKLEAEKVRVVTNSKRI